MMPSALAERYNKWLLTPYGEMLSRRQHDLMASILLETAGYRAMELVVSTQGRLCANAPQLHRFALAEFPMDEVSGVCDFHNLPLPSDTVELAVLNHVLDFCEYPHESLKEAARVLQPSGTLVIVGFNPLSFLGVLRWPLRFLCSGLQWESRALSVLRMTDWLKLLGFQCEKTCYGSYNLPLQSYGTLARMGWFERLATRLRLPLGSFYIIVARKHRLRISGHSKPEWLAKAIKPVKLTSDTSVKPSKVGTRSKHEKKSGDIH